MHVNATEPRRWYERHAGWEPWDLVREPCPMCTEPLSIGDVVRIRLVPNGGGSIEPGELGTVVAIGEGASGRFLRVRVERAAGARIEGTFVRTDLQLQPTARAHQGPPG